MAEEGIFWRCPLAILAPWPSGAGTPGSGLLYTGRINHGPARRSAELAIDPCQKPPGFTAFDHQACFLLRAPPQGSGPQLEA